MEPDLRVVDLTDVDMALAGKALVRKIITEEEESDVAEDVVRAGAQD